MEGSKVFVVMAGFNYEGGELNGIFSSLGAAMKRVREITGSGSTVPSLGDKGEETDLGHLIRHEEENGTDGWVEILEAEVRS